MITSTPRASILVLASSLRPLSVTRISTSWAFYKTDLQGNITASVTGISRKFLSGYDVGAMLTDTGYMEPEGIKIRNGIMYCGYAAKNSKGDY